MDARGNGCDGISSRILDPKKLELNENSEATMPLPRVTSLSELRVREGMLIPGRYDPENRAHP